MSAAGTSTQQLRASRPKLWTSSAKQAQQSADPAGLTQPTVSATSGQSESVLPSVPTSPPSPPFHTRVGLNFQARLPPLSLPSPPAASAAPSSVDGEAVWQPSKAPSDATVESYLSAVQDLFAERPDDFDEETALLFLHRCNYNTQLALALVQPHALGRDTDMPAMEGAASPPSDLSPATSDDSELESDDDTDDVCSVCMDGGTLIICERRGCRRVYHVDCAGLKEVPRGRWECPVHFCSICGDDWTEGSRRKKARLDSSSATGSAGGMGGGGAGSEALKPITSHPSLISSSSQPHLLSPASSHSPTSSFPHTSPPPHVACSSCPTAYCLPHMPPSLSAAYSIPVEQLATLTLDGLQERVSSSINGLFLCLSCIGVQERRRRLEMLRRLNAMMDEREEKAKASSGSKPAATSIGGGGKGSKVEAERERDESDPLFTLYSAFKQQELRDDEAAAADMSGASEGLGFDRMLHHPTEWRRLEGTLVAVEQTDVKKAEAAGGAVAKGSGTAGEAMRD